MTDASSPDSPQTSAPIAGADLDRSLVRGVAWTAGAKWLSQMITWPVTLIVARLLTPSDYGFVGLAMIYVGLVNLLNEFGLGTAIVRHRHLTERQIAQVNGLCVMFGCAGFLLSIGAAYPIALFYREPGLEPVVMALSVTFLLTSLKTIPLSLMQRDLEFHRVAIHESVGTIAQSATLVLLAYLGFRYWSLVIAAIGAAVVTAALANWQRAHPIAWPRRAEIRDEIRLGADVVGSRLGWYVYSNADFFVVGRFLGTAALGAYTFGWNMASVPVDKISALLGRVTPAIFSAAREDKVAIRRYFTRLTSGIASLTLPAGIGLALVAEDLVKIALGDQWSATVVPLQLLAIYASFRSIVPLVNALGTMIGESAFIMRTSLAGAVLMPVAFLIGSRWGTSGVATAWILAYPLVALPQFVVVFKRIDMRTPEYLRSLWPALSSALLMVPGVWLLRHSVGGGWPIGVRLAVECATGAAIYAAAMFGFHRQEVRVAQELVQMVRNRSGRSSRA